MSDDRDVIVIPEDGALDVVYHFDVDGVALDFAGCDARVQVRDTRSRDAELRATLTSDGGLIALNHPSTGDITLRFTQELVAQLPGPRSYAWDLRLLDSGGHPDYPIGGVLIVPVTVTAPEETP